MFFSCTFRYFGMFSSKQVALVIDRYERIASGEVRTLKNLHRQIIEGEQRRENTAGLRNQAKRVEDQLLCGLSQILSTRTDLDGSFQEEFDQRIEPIRKLIQTTVNGLQCLPSPSNSEHFNPFENDGNEEEPNIYAEEARLQMSGRREMELKSKLEEARMVQEETAKLDRDIEDLNQIFSDLATLVHQQHDVVDSIEEHVEQAVRDVQRGDQQLKKAVQSKNAKVPLVTAVVGGLALGGPIGLAAGSTIAGVAAAVGGAFAGLYGGRYIKKSNVDDTTTTVSEEK